MSLRFISPLALCTAAVLVVSCGPREDDLPLIAGNTGAVAAKGEEIYVEAKAADDAGKSKKAVKLYDEVATRYPFAPSAPKGRFRQAEILQEQGEILESFKAYQQFLVRFQGSGLYATALGRQAAMAQSAADGEIKSAFLGIKSKLSLDKTVEMLGQVRDNAPKSRTAAKAQFSIGQLYESRTRSVKSKEAIAAYRQLVRDQPEAPEAPEALFRVGVILTGDADRGSKNQATLDLAREAFNDYLIQYPNHHRSAEARQFIANLGGRELQRTLDTAEFYEKTGNLESAKVYYRDVVKRASSGPLHDAARERLKALGE